MADHDQGLIEAFDACLERIFAGESIDDVIGDYPEYAERLRDLLQMGDLVHQAQYSSGEVADDALQVQPRVLQAMRQKRQRRGLSPTFVWLAAAAMVVFAVGLGGLWAALNVANQAPSQIELTATEIAYLAPTTVAQVKLTQTQAAQIVAAASAMPEIFGTPTPFTGGTIDASGVTLSTPLAVVTLAPNMSMTPRFTTTPVPGAISGIGGTATVSSGDSGILPGLTATPEPTGTMTTTPTGTPPPTATAPGTLEGLARRDVEMTATSLASLFNEGGGMALSPTLEMDVGGEVMLTPFSDFGSATPLPTMPPASPPPDYGACCEEGIVPTSVYVMSPVPVTPLAYMPTFTPPAPYLTAVAAAPTLPPEGTLAYAPTQVGMAIVPGSTRIPSTPTPALPQVIPLNAGEIDDNADWDTYLTYRSNYLQQYGAGTVHDVDVTRRQIITVTDTQGLPVLGARVRVYMDSRLVSETRTYATGQTLFFPNAQPETQGVQSFRVVVDKGSSSAEFQLDPQRGPHWTAKLQNVTHGAVKLDVLFMLDATGSMADEIYQLQTNILGISQQIDELPGNVDVRYGLVAYRDRFDDYITRVYDFTPEVSQFQMLLDSVEANYGGDYPESVNQALHESLERVSWRGEDTVKLIFIVADAPPHLDYQQDYDYALEMRHAAERGIKIHPIASSGLDQQAEYIFRQIAQHTMGHFIFLTYNEESGTPGEPGDLRSELEVGEPADPQTQQQGDYTVERLDELVMDLIKAELANLPGGTQTSSLLPDLSGFGLLPPMIGMVGLVGFSFYVGFTLRDSMKRKNQMRRKNDEDHLR